MICGLVILMAGGAQLIRLSRSQDRVEVLSEGQAAVVGEAQAKVVSSRIMGQQVEVTVEVTPPATGVTAGLSAAEPWSLLVGGTLVAPQTEAGSCRDLPLDGGASGPISCTVVFGAGAGTKTLAFRWGDTQRQWQLTV
jgi:hypothetical protein